MSTVFHNTSLPHQLLHIHSRDLKTQINASLNTACMCVHDITAQPIFTLSDQNYIATTQADMFWWMSIVAHLPCVVLSFHRDCCWHLFLPLCNSFCDLHSQLWNLQEQNRFNMNDHMHALQLILFEYQYTVSCHSASCVYQYFLLVTQLVVHEGKPRRGLNKHALYMHACSYKKGIV